jgi:hypothetical protein
MSEQSARCPACKKVIDRVRVIEVLPDSATQSGHEAVVALLACPHCAVAISAQLLGAIG